MTRNKVAISLLLFCLTSLALSKPSPTQSPNKSQFSRRLVLRKSPANLQLQAVRSSRQIQPPSIPALYSAPKPLESDARTEASSPSPAYGPPSSTTEEATATTEMVTEDSMDDVSTPEPGMSETDTDAGENEVDQGTERTEYLPPKKAKDQDMIETNPYQHQIQIHVVPPHLSQEDNNNEILRPSYGVPQLPSHLPVNLDQFMDMARESMGLAYLPPSGQKAPERKSNEQNQVPAQEIETPRKDGSQASSSPRPDYDSRSAPSSQIFGTEEVSYQPPTSYMHFVSRQPESYGPPPPQQGNVNGGYRQEMARYQDQNQGYRAPQMQDRRSGLRYSEQQPQPAQQGYQVPQFQGGYSQQREFDRQPEGGYNAIPETHSQPRFEAPQRQQQQDNDAIVVQDQTFQQQENQVQQGGYFGGDSGHSQGYSQQQPQHRQYTQIPPQHQPSARGYPDSTGAQTQQPVIPPSQYGAPRSDAHQVENSVQGYNGPQFFNSNQQPQAAPAPFQPRPQYNQQQQQQGYPQNFPAVEEPRNQINSQQGYQAQPQGGYNQQQMIQPMSYQQGQYFQGNFIPQMMIHNSLDSAPQDEELEGLNGKIVDAALLQRVQEIIAEHERQQQALLASANFDSSNQASNPTQQYGTPFQGPSPQQEQHQSFPQVSSEPQDTGYPQHQQPQSQGKLQADAQRQPQSGQGYPEQRSENMVEYQRAILSQHFTESVLEGRHSSQGPQLEAQAHQSSYGTPQFEELGQERRSEPEEVSSRPEGLRVIPAPQLGRSQPEEEENPKPSYGVPLAPVIGLDSQENFRVVEDVSYGAPLQNNFLQPGQRVGFGGGRNRRRVGRVMRVRASAMRRNIPVFA